MVRPCEMWSGRLPWGAEAGQASRGGKDQEGHAVVRGGRSGQPGRSMCMVRSGWASELPRRPRPGAQKTGRTVGRQEEEAGWGSVQEWRPSPRQQRQGPGEPPEALQPLGFGPGEWVPSRGLCIRTVACSQGGDTFCLVSGKFLWSEGDTGRSRWSMEARRRLWAPAASTPNSKAAAGCGRPCPLCPTPADASARAGVLEAGSLNYWPT